MTLFFALESKVIFSFLAYALFYLTQLHKNKYLLSFILLLLYFILLLICNLEISNNKKQQIEHTFKAKKTK
jgi:uncharacterized membrane protein